MSLSPAASTLLCPICGQPNQCGLAQVPDADKASAPCWCRNLTIDPAVLAKLPADQRDMACICPRCAGSVAPSTEAPKQVSPC